MLMYAKILNEETKEVSVGDGTNADFYEKIGMTLQEVEATRDGRYYLAGYLPEEETPQTDEAEEAQLQILELEAQQTPRLMREAIEDMQAGLTSSYALDKLQEIDAAIAVQREIIHNSGKTINKKSAIRKFFGRFFGKKEEEDA